MKFKILITSLLILNISQSFADNKMFNFDTIKTRQDGLARNFRDLSQFSLNAIASGEFSENELKKVREKFPQDKITIVDLRRESHVLVNGFSASWEESNTNKTIAEILLDEESKISLIKKDPKNSQINLLEPKISELKTIKTEMQLAKENGFEYKRFAIQDRGIPTQEQFDEIVNFIKTMHSDQKLYVHCAAGKGRTTTFLVIYDILKNSNKVALTEIFKRQEKAGGARIDLVNDETSNRSDLVKKRLEMLTKLYNSSNSN